MPLAQSLNPGRNEEQSSPFGPCWLSETKWSQSEVTWGESEESVGNHFHEMQQIFVYSWQMLQVYK